MVTRRKVLFFYQDFGAMGGIERYLLRTAAWLKARNTVEPVVVCCENTPLFDALQAEGLKVYGVPNRPMFSRSLWRMFDIAALWALARILRKERPDIVHVHIGLLENLFIRLMGCPVVYTVHGYSSLYSLQDTQNKLKLAFKKLIRTLFRKTGSDVDALLFVSGAEQSRMLHEGYITHQAAGEVLHNGLPVAEIRQRVETIDPAEARQKLGIAADARVVSYIDRLDANKGPLQFIALARRLSQAGGLEAQSLHFVMAGDGPLAEAVQRQASQWPNVHILGYREDVTALLAISDVIVHPARREGFGLGIVEAMAAGVPCVAYASGGAMEILDVAGLDACLAPVDDFEALVQRTHAVLTLPDTKKAALSQALKQRAACFDRERFVERLEAVYAKLCPKISVILPVYQGEATILRAVRSVLNQTYPHLELIVVDDGSTDSTLHRLASIRDARLTVLRQENQGVAAARNHGFSQATGQFIGFIDADDVWLPEKLACETEVLRKHPQDPCLLYSGYYAVDDQDRLFHLPPIGREAGDLSQAVLDQEGIFLPSTSLVHRRVFEAVGGFKPGCYHEDRVFFIEACQQFPAYPTGRRLVMYRQSEAGRCRRVLRNFEEAVQAELSIADSLQAILPQDALQRLSIRQSGNLVQRFLMYGYLAHARQLHQRMEAAGLPNRLDGKKGLLAQLSLISGINFLAATRMLVQACTQLTMAPGWAWKTRHLLRERTAAEVHPVFTPIQQGA